MLPSEHQKRHWFCPTRQPFAIATPSSTRVIRLDLQPVPMVGCAPAALPFGSGLVAFDCSATLTAWLAAGLATHSRILALDARLPGSRPSRTANSSSHGLSRMDSARPLIDPD